MKAAVLPRPPFLVDQTLKVGWRLEVLAATPEPRGACDGVVTFRDPHSFEIREHNERATRAVVRDGVILVEVYFVLVLTARNGQVLGTSETYESREARERGIGAVKESAGRAGVEG